MRIAFFGSFLVVALAACAGFANDVEKGIHQSEKEIKGERPPPPADAALPQLPGADAGAPPATQPGDGGDISL